MVKIKISLSPDSFSAAKSVCIFAINVLGPDNCFLLLNLFLFLIRDQALKALEPFCVCIDFLFISFHFFRHKSEWASESKS